MLIYFGIGSNIGERDANLRNAIELLQERVGECIASSSIYRSAPQGFVSENEFANMVVLCETTHSLEDILTITQEIEREMGREKKSINGIYHDRIIDIDLLKAYDYLPFTSYLSSLTYESSTLILPHPRMHERDFVMIPFREVEQLYCTLKGRK